ncbi:MAG: 5-bromo-4-chloroindolyl phosphate hydrolysis family protein [Alkalilacustris sp.]
MNGKPHGHAPATRTATPDWQRRRPSRAGGRSNLLFFLPIPFAVQALGADPGGLALKLSAAGLLLAAAWLTREGLRAQDAWEARPLSRPPALPRKALGAGAIGLGVALACAAGGAAAQGLVLGALATGLHLVAFGLDPRRDRTGSAADLAALRAERVARALDATEPPLAEMTAAIARLGDPALTDRVTRFADTVRTLAKSLERDPRGFASARRHLGVYLIGARDAAVRFADLQARAPDPALRARFDSLLDDLERSYAHRLAALREGDRTALDIEIDVLQDRLTREGLGPDGP